jgi:hypothetical protein
VNDTRIVKATINGKEYAFAELLLGQLRIIHRLAKEPQTDGFNAIETWIPLIESSMMRAGSEMPDLDGLTVGEANNLIAELIRNVMRATGVESAIAAEVKT